MTTSLHHEDWFIPSDTPGLELHLRNKRRAGQTVFGAARTVVLMHGATYSSGSLYDTALDGYSFMDFLAHAGFDVYGVDVRGYGGASRLPEMAEPASSHAPLVRTEVAIRDLATAIDHVLRSKQLERVNLIGMSWGGSVSGAYTARHGSKVQRLALIAPQWLSKVPIPLDTGGALDAYRVVTVPAARERWLGAAPAGKRHDLIPAGGFDGWLANTLRDEPDALLRQQQSIRVPNGAVLDIREYWGAGTALYRPEDIAVPVLLVHGEWDVDVPLALAQDYFSHLTGAPGKRWLELGEATHMLMLEKNRQLAFDALAAFMNETLAAPVAADQADLAVTL